MPKFVFRRSEHVSVSIRPIHFSCIIISLDQKLVCFRSTVRLFSFPFSAPVRSLRSFLPRLYSPSPFIPFHFGLFFFRLVRIFCFLRCPRSETCRKASTRHAASVAGNKSTRSHVIRFFLVGFFRSRNVLLAAGAAHIALEEAQGVRKRRQRLSWPRAER